MAMAIHQKLFINRNMNISKIAAALLLGRAALSTHAETPQDTAIRKAIAPWLGDGATIDSVTKTPYAGLYEVRVGGDIFYTDAQAKYLFIGRVLDAKTTEDYTKARVDEINRIKFSELRLLQALPANAAASRQPDRLYLHVQHFG